MRHNCTNLPSQAEVKYGLAHGWTLRIEPNVDGTSWVEISFCPWCGANLTTQERSAGQ